jgi:hypothetical protein
MRGWEMRWRILIMQSEGDEGGICVVAESCHQTSEGIGLMASTLHRSLFGNFKPGRSHTDFNHAGSIGPELP